MIKMTPIELLVIVITGLFVGILTWKLCDTAAEVIVEEQGNYLYGCETGKEIENIEKAMETEIKTETETELEPESKQKIRKYVR